MKIEEKKPKTLNEKIDNINEKLEIVTQVKSKGKKVKLKGVNERKLKMFRKSQKRLVLLLTNDGNIIPQFIKPNQGMFVVNGVPIRASTAYRYLYKGKYPTFIIPEWSLEPLGLKQFYDTNPTGTSVADLTRAILAYSKSNEVSAKKSLGAKSWIFIGIAIIAGLYIFFGGGATP